MLKFTIKPHDVLFFGSGKPFNIGGVAESIFPPFPNSFASAVYAKFYSETGIALTDGKGIYKAVYGPFIEKEGKIYFPAPLDIMKEKKKDDMSKIAVASLRKEFKLLSINDTDIGEKIQSILWTKDNDIQIEYEPLRGFISLEGLKKWYNNQKIENSDLLQERDIFIKEDRISIFLDDNTGTVREEDGLYRVQFVRLKEEVKLVFWIEADYSDSSLLCQNNIKIDDELIKIFNTNPKVLKIGGEARTAWYEMEENDFTDNFKNFNTNNASSQQYKVLFLTPGVFHDNSNGKNITDYFENINASTIGGYVIGSIASKHYDKYKKKTIRAIKPGSVIYLENIQNGFDKTINFYKPADSFIGSNLVLIKKL